MFAITFELRDKLKTGCEPLPLEFSANLSPNPWNTPSNVKHVKILFSNKKLALCSKLDLTLPLCWLSSF
jgi:hypothetical protein